MIKVRTLATKPSNLLDLQNSHDRRGEPTPTGCYLASILVLWQACEPYTISRSTSVIKGETERENLKKTFILNGESKTQAWTSLSGRSMYSDMGDEISCDSHQATIPISNAFNTGKKRQKGGEEGRERKEERETERKGR